MTTGETVNISEREPDAPAAGAAQNPGSVGGAVDRVKAEHRAKVKKNAVRKANDAIRARQKGESSRLQFTKEERADPALSKSIGKADKAADRLDKANAKIPTRKKSPRSAFLTSRQARQRRAFLLGKRRGRPTAS